jgi:hypothetical protein
VRRIVIRRDDLGICLVTVVAKVEPCTLLSTVCFFVFAKAGSVSHRPRLCYTYASIITVGLNSSMRAWSSAMVDCWAGRARSHLFIVCWNHLPLSMVLRHHIVPSAGGVVDGSWGGVVLLARHDRKGPRSGL